MCRLNAAGAADAPGASCVYLCLYVGRFEYTHMSIRETDANLGIRVPFYGHISL